MKDNGKMLKELQEFMSPDDMWNYVYTHTNIRDLLENGDASLKTLVRFGFVCGVNYALDNIVSIEDE